MSVPEEAQTARDLGLMQDFPPPSDKRVTRENQMYGPFNRWSFQNELRLNRTADVWRGNGPVAPLAENPTDLSHVTYKNFAGTQFTFDEMVDLSYTDGILVLHQGKVIYERYLNDLQPHSLHAWASGSKSMTGTLAAFLAHEGLFELDEWIATYLPELKASGFGDATVRQVVDMTPSVGFPNPRADPIAEDWQYGVAMGWCARPEGYAGAETVYDMLPLMTRTGEHGLRFAYLTPNTDVLARCCRIQSPNGRR